jgi:hypothetical protein
VTRPGRRIVLKTLPRDVSREVGVRASDLAWAPTHSLLNPFTEVVDHSEATSILAAGFGLVFTSLFRRGKLDAW